MGCKKLSFGLIVIILLVLLTINLICSEVLIGNSSGEINNAYSPNSQIKGWVNISLVNEPASSQVSLFDKRISLFDFIKYNTGSYNCTPSDCKESYELSNPQETKIINLNRGESKIIGFKITGKMNSDNSNPISKFSFNINSDVSKSCNEQLRIDLNDDDSDDWVQTNGTGNHGCFSYTGCFNSSATLERRGLSKTQDYCERVRVLKTPSLQIGANIKVNENNYPSGQMTMKILDSERQEIPGGKCTIPGITGSWQVSCNRSVAFLNETFVYVCIRANDADNNYEIEAENSGENCGFFDVGNTNAPSWDYNLFAHGGEYAPIGSFTFNDNIFRKFDKTNSEKILEYVNEYIANKYRYNCENGCVIPIKFISGENQQITISNLAIDYTTDSGELSDNKIYNADKISSKLNSRFLKLDLALANFSAPLEIRNYSAEVFIGDKKILEKDIEVKAISQVTSVVPNNPPASFPVSFTAILDRVDDNMSFVWNFGDNSSEETTNINIIKHSYPNVGNYRLTVKAIGKNGESIGTFNINAVSPISIINKTISDYLGYIKNTEGEIANLPEWIKKGIDEKINLTDTKDIVNRQKKIYDDGLIDNAKAVQIMKTLLLLKVPTSVFVSNEVVFSPYIMKEDAIDIDVLTLAGAGKSSATKKQYYNGIVNWIRENMNAGVEINTYSVSYADKENEVLFSNVKVTLDPKSKIKELFFVINGDSEKIKINQDLRTTEKTNYISFSLDNLENEKIIEILYPGQVDILNLPFYFTPQFKDLTLTVDTGDCNFNQICDSDEDYKTCSDCTKPWFGKAIFWIVILLIIAFVFYIMLQEWYKRYYEKSLFKDRNQLFNLINYINSSELKGVFIGESTKELKKMNWKDEQISYAIKKLHGERTGMYEIPIFKIFENIKVKKEINKRQGAGVKGVENMRRTIAPLRIPPRGPFKQMPNNLEKSLIKEPTRNNSRGFFKR